MQTQKYGSGATPSLRSDGTGGEGGSGCWQDSRDKEGASTNGRGLGDTDVVLGNGITSILCGGRGGREVGCGGEGGIQDGEVADLPNLCRT